MSANLVGYVLLDQYRVDAYVASGGMGTVYRVWDLKRNVYLAMKVLHADLADDPSIFKRFEREANALRNLTHPNIVPFYGLFRSFDFAFLLELFVDGPSLKDILKERGSSPLSVQESLIYLKALSAALGYAHVHGVIHCDVKPGNVMIDRGGNIYLTDFGIARHAESTVTTLATIGTAAYMAPEQIKGEMVRPETDVYALGVILFEMVTGRRPFQGDESGTESAGRTANERIRFAHLKSDPPNPRSLNPSLANSLAQVILKALSKYYWDRYPSTQAFLEAVCAELGTRPADIPDRAPVQVSQTPSSVPLPPSPGWTPMPPSWSDVPSSDKSVPFPKSVPKSIKRNQLIWAIGSIFVLLSLVFMALSGRIDLPRTTATTGVADTLTVIYITATRLPSLTNTPTSRATQRPTRTPLPTSTPTPEGPLALFTLIGHGDNVRSVQFSADGRTFASASADGIIRLWDVLEGSSVGILPGHSDVVDSIAFSPQGDVLASASYDQSIRLWDLKSQSNLLTRTGAHADRITDIAFSPDGSTIATSSRDNTVRMWDASSLLRLRTLNNNSYALSVDFNYDGSFLASGGSDNSIRIWNAVTGGLLYQLKGHWEWVQVVVFSPVSNFLVSGSSDGTIRLWALDKNGGRLLSTLPAGTEKVKDLAFSPDGRFIIAVTGEGALMMLKISGESLEVLNFIPWDKTICSEFSPNGNYLATGSQDNIVRIWNVRDILPASESMPSEGPLNSLTSDTYLPKPNILLLISDDQRYDTMDYMPQTKNWIFDQGVTFSRGYITTSSCCPSRSSILTGMYAHNHGVLVNQDELQVRTFVQDLHQAGYTTGLVGKYLNSWDGTPKPEFDFWVSFEGGSVTYFDPKLNVQGDWKEHQGYITYILRDYALKFLDEALKADKPFLLIFTPNAPHEPAEPAPGDELLYPNLSPYRSPSFNEEDVSDKPEWVQEYEPFSSDRIAYIDTIRRKQLQTLHALDQAVGEFMNTLAEAQALENSFVIYLSDNGFFWGEHRRDRGKGYAYEESILVPFGIRFPPLIPQPREDTHLVANIDLAPTFYDLAGISIPANIDGLSLIPLLRGSDLWRDKLIVENWIRFGPYVGVRSDRYLYVEWESYRPELYDSQVDPFQNENQAENQEYANIVSEFQAYLEDMLIGQ
jgi:WD40 repeat protein/serine/threonine protein kinase